MAAQFLPFRIFGSPKNVDPLIRLWILRILIPLSGHSAFVNRNGFMLDTLAEAMGLGHWIDPEDKKFSAIKVRNELRKLHLVAENEAK